MAAIVLSIGTTHPWNVAGVGRDLVVGGALGARVFTAVAAVSAQDAGGVVALGATATELFVAQLARAAVASAQAVRIGALPTAHAVRAVAAPLRERPDLPAVVDPGLRRLARRRAERRGRPLRRCATSWQCCRTSC